ncbi:MAG: GIY-YIG nuclease family protein [Actinomycetota bacterium]
MLGELPEAGLYCLVLYVASGTQLRIGARGSLAARRGYYVYVGRAKRNLAVRLRSHAFARGRNPRWHIDHLLRVARPVEVWVFPLVMEECALADLLVSQGGARPSLKGFGSSDCRCPGHLVFFGVRRPSPPQGLLPIFRAQFPLYGANRRPTRIS